MKIHTSKYRQIGVQQQMQIFNPVSGHDKVEKNGNADTKILVKAFEEFAAQGLTLEARQTIEKMDDLLKNADIVISKDGKKATIAQEDGQSFTIEAKIPTGRSGR